MASTLDSIKSLQHTIEKYASDEQRVLKCIDKLYHLHVTVQHLQDTGVGRTVNALRKEPGNVGTAARALVNKWKLMVASEENSEPEDHCHDTAKYNGNGHGKDSDDNTHQSRRGEGRAPPDPPPANGDRSAKRKYSSTEESEPDTKKTRPHRDTHQKEEVKLETKIKQEPSSSDSDQSDSQSDSDTSESSEEDVKEPVQIKQEIKTEPRDVSPRLSHVKDEPKETTSRRHHHDTERHKSRESKSGDEKSKSRSSSHKSSKEHENSPGKKSSHRSKERESSSQRHSATEKQTEKSHKDKESSSKTEKHTSSHYKSDKHKHKSSSDKEADKHRHKSTSDKDKHRKESSSKEKHSSSHTSKDKHSSSNSSSKEKHNSSDSSKEKHGSSHISKEKHSSSDKSSKEKHSHKESKHSSDSKSKSKSDTNSESERDGRHKSSSSSKHRSKGSKEDVPKRKKETAADSDDGIDCGSGASFAEALGMSVSPAKKEAKRRPPAARESPFGAADLSPASLLAPSAPLPPLPPLHISALPDISPHYRPRAAPRPPPPPAERGTERAAERALERDSDAAFQSRIAEKSKNQRTKVYSGNKVYGHVPSLYELCVLVLQEHIDALEYTGGVPYDLLRPVVDRAVPAQLLALEHHNPYLLEDTDHLWRAHCARDFRREARREMETWREMYVRCQEEQESRLRSLTSSIRLAQAAKLAPVRQVKMAYVDSAAKPPRQVARKQAIHGTARPVAASPAARVASLAGPAAPRAGSGRPAPAAAAAACARPKKAPLMQKALQFMRGRKR